MLTIIVVTVFHHSKRLGMWLRDDTDEHHGLNIGN